MTRRLTCVAHTASVRMDDPATQCTPEIIQLRPGLAMLLMSGECQTAVHIPFEIECAPVSLCCNLTQRQRLTLNHGPGFPAESTRGRQRLLTILAGYPN